MASNWQLSMISHALNIFRWDFKTEGHDIKFGVRAVNTKTGEKFNEVDLKRVASHETEETGFITCQAGHKCKHNLKI
jgi:hypothetical protein